MVGIAVIAIPAAAAIERRDRSDELELGGGVCQ